MSGRLESDLAVLEMQLLIPLDDLLGKGRFGRISLILHRFCFTRCATSWVAGRVLCCSSYLLKWCTF